MNTIEFLEKVEQEQNQFEKNSPEKQERISRSIGKMFEKEAQKALSIAHTNNNNLDRASNDARLLLIQFAARNKEIQIALEDELETSIDTPSINFLKVLEAVSEKIQNTKSKIESIHIN